MNAGKLIGFARQALRSAVTLSPVVEPNPEALPKKFSEPTGCFVTLTEHGQLRGCIGHITPQEALFKAVADNARSGRAPTMDASYRCNQRTGPTRNEISVLTVPDPLKFSSPEDLLNKLQPHRDGVVLRIGQYGAT